MFANGGDGGVWSGCNHALGHPGGGGRVAIYFDTWEHTGKVSAHGGFGNGNSFGQPGTVYLNSIADPSETVLVIDTGVDSNGAVRTSTGEFPFYDPETPSNLQYTFQNMRLDGNINVKFTPKLPGVNAVTMLTIRSLIGSNTAKITVAKHQTLKLLGYSGSSTQIGSSGGADARAIYDQKEAQILTFMLDTPFETSIVRTEVQHLGEMLSTRVDITVEDGGTLQLPKTLVVAGGQTVQIMGNIIGLRNLIIDATGSVTLEATGSTVGEAPGNYVIDYISIRRGGVLNTQDVNLTSSTFTLGSGISDETMSYVNAKGISSFTAGNLFIGQSGKFNGVTHGYGNGLGPGSGSKGDGASHGGRGYRQSINGMVAGKGAGYGSYMWPTTMGSGGGVSTTTGSASTSGGRGGSAISLHVTETFTHNGIVDVSGERGQSNFGSGAAGSILVTTKKIQGIGTFVANGAIRPPGSSYVHQYGYESGGGRVAVHCLTSTWTGKSTAYATSNAGPGTVYYDCDDRKDTLIIE